MCGIAGVSLIKNATPAQCRIATNKLKILGLFNQSRGTHGCGLYLNGEIYKGIEDLVAKKNTKEFDDFISNEYWVWPEMDLTKGNIAFLHTRQATNGAHIEANTHPFRIKSEDPKNTLVGVHNGSIEGIWSLCTKHGVDHAGLHIHVDSKALYTLIDIVGIKILEEYKGYAALLWTKPSEPNSIYVFHGATRKDRNSEEIWEERPMWYLKTAEGIYFSSLVSSLNAIRESKKQVVEELEYNTVFKVTNGKFTGTKTVIDRRDANLTPAYVAPVRRTELEGPIQQGANCRVLLPIGFDQHRNLRVIAEESARSAALREGKEERDTNLTKSLKTPSESIVWRETVPPVTLATFDKDAIRYYKGRHRRAGGKLCCNLLWIKDRGLIGEEGEEGVKPYWFWQGVMLRDKDCYEQMVIESKIPGGWVGQLTSNWAYGISRFSKNPVTNLDSEAVDANNFFRFSWYFDERIVKAAQVRPDFSGRCYTISNGFCIKIIPSNADDKEVLEGKQTELDLTPPHAPIVGDGWKRNSAGILVRDANCCTNPSVEKSVFDIVFDTLDDVWPVLTVVHKQAMEEYVADDLRQKWHGHPREEDVQNELWMSIRTAIAAGKTIREGLNDKMNTLESYVKIVSEAPPISIDSIEAIPSFVDRMEFYDKYGHWPDDDRPKVKDKVRNDMPWDLVEEEGNDEPLIDAENFVGINQVLDYIENKREKEQAMLAETNKHVEDLIGSMNEISNIADELQCRDEDDYAQDVANVVYKGVATLKNELTEACALHHQEGQIQKINQLVHAK